MCLSLCAATSDFWNAFWPNFASTLLGLLIGVPIALWINRRVMITTHRNQAQADFTRLIMALRTLYQALSINHKKLQYFRASMEEVFSKFDLGLDISAWDAVKLEIMHHLHHPMLQQQLAYYFSRLQTLTKLTELHLDFEAGINAAVEDSERTRDKLRADLITLINELDQESMQLMDTLKLTIEARKFDQYEL